MLQLFHSSFFYQNVSVLHHPNIVLFMGYTCEKDVIQIIMNYVHGNDLYHLIFTEVWDIKIDINLLFL